jgi:hypothetical protein
VLLVLVLLSGGLIALLMLNTVLNQESFQLTRLQKQTSRYTDQQQGLQQQLDRMSAPSALAEQARRLGMVPGGDPAFLSPDGKVAGEASRITAPAPPVAPPSPPPVAPPSPPPSASASAGASPGARASAGAATPAPTSTPATPQGSPSR